jgi:hypothetical protein
MSGRFLEELSRRGVVRVDDVELLAVL